jgi:hypothetical protein
MHKTGRTATPPAYLAEQTISPRNLVPFLFSVGTGSIYPRSLVLTPRSTLSEELSDRRPIACLGCMHRSCPKRAAPCWGPG